MRSRIHGEFMSFEAIFGLERERVHELDTATPISLSMRLTTIYEDPHFPLIIMKKLT